jgi:hypothetical protein
MQLEVFSGTIEEGKVDAAELAEVAARKIEAASAKPAAIDSIVLTISPRVWRSFKDPTFAGNPSLRSNAAQPEGENARTVPPRAKSCRTGTSD